LNNYPGWLADLIKENDCGVAVPPERADLFADALERLAVNPAERREMGVNSRRLAERRFDRKDLADKFVDFLEKNVAYPD
ncbi:MAG: glycosyltransferase WbuB, partial [Gammaproteobacteria bacterium]|nr:glycosyltransferase WbuB [Gammaproteobacteria bacterium]